MQHTRTGFLPLIIFSQFAGTSMWFAGNAVIDQITASPHGIASITTFVQLGFISGTLIFAMLTIADRFAPVYVFFMSSVIAAVANASIIYTSGDMALTGMLRFITGFFLAGIYPVGMKIAADLYPAKLGKALGYLVGALVLGTAFPHILRTGVYIEWQYVIAATSLMAIAGGLLMLVFIPPRLSPGRSRFEPAAFIRVFSSGKFRSAALGYFGHMWELYAFWAFIPVMLNIYNAGQQQAVSVPLWSFLVIAAGCAGCIAGGYIAQKKGSRPVAFTSLFISGVCCLAAPFLFNLPPAAFAAFLLLWGATVVSDSPQFSTMVAQAAIPQYKGTALTIVTSVGFAITIVSIQLLQQLSHYGAASLWLLAAGPVFGLLAMSLKK